MAREISNRDDVIDGRDVVKRYEELKDEVDTLLDLVADHDDKDNPVSVDEAHEAAIAVQEFLDDDDLGGELKRLEELIDEAPSSLSDGETLIRDTYFEDYARQLAEDIGALEHCDKWPATCIDWERAADELKQDYGSVEYGDVTYWVRW